MKLRQRRRHDAIGTRDGGSIMNGRWRWQRQTRVVQRIRVQPANGIVHELDEVVLAHCREPRGLGDGCVRARAREIYIDTRKTKEFKI